MNRKQVLKNVKRKKKEKSVVENEDYLNGFVGTIGLIIVLLIIGYLIIGIFVTKTITFGNKEEEETNEVIIDNTTILAGQILDQKEDDYYVLIYSFDDDRMLLRDWADLFLSDEEFSTIYLVDSDNKLNASYITTEESNMNPTNYSDLKVKSPTLIRVQNKKIIEYLEGETNIIEFFKG